MSITKQDLQAAAEASDELPVIGYLKQLREGEFIQELDDALHAAINKATDLGKPAMVTIKIGITPAGRTVVLDDQIGSKLPEAPRDATIFFLDKGNTLTRKDPKQTTFPVEAGFAGTAAPAINQ